MITRRPNGKIHIVFTKILKISIIINISHYLRFGISCLIAQRGAGVSSLNREKEHAVHAVA